MKKIVSILAGAALMIAATSAMALTIGPAGSYVESNGFKYYDTGAESVVLTDADGVQDDATAFLMLELAGFANSNKFGMYGFTTSGTTVTKGNTLEIFNGADSPLTAVTLAFNLAAGTVTNQNTGLSALIGKEFGFYINTPQNQTYYTHTYLNVNKEDHFKVYNTSDNKAGGLFGSDVVLGIEDLLGLGDKDFNDMVVGVTDVAPVPEPGTIVLLGAGLLGLGFYGRRRAQK